MSILKKSLFNKDKITALGVMLIFSASFGIRSISAQSVSTKSTEQIEAKVIGRVLFDAGSYIPNTINTVSTGYEFADLRVGFKAKYKNFGVKFEGGFANNKVKIKDAFITYTIDKNTFTIGQSFQPFSMDWICSTYNTEFHQTAGITNVFTYSRRPGLSHMYNTDHFMIWSGIYVGGGKIEDKFYEPGYSVNTRLVFRPVYETGNILHLGYATAVLTPDGVSPEDPKYKTFTLASPGITTIQNETPIQAIVTESDLQWKNGLELLLIKNRWVIQGEYICGMINRLKGLPTFWGHGGYAQAGFFLKGTSQPYDDECATVGRIKEKAIKLALRYSYTNLNGGSSEICGGIAHDISLGANVYFTPNFSVKVNYGLISFGHNQTYTNMNTAGILQVRFQAVI